MSEIGSSNWSETAASNNATPPDGWPEGQNPDTVNNCAREGMSAVKKFWNRSNTVKTTGGTTTAYTLTYDVAEAQYYSGEEFAFIVNATCGSSPTLNVNGLGAKNIRKFSGGAFTNCTAGDLVANQPLRVYYNSGATTFDIVASPLANTWQALDSQTLAAASSYSLQSIATSINHLQVLFDLTVSGTGVNLVMQYYNSSGTLDSSTDYNSGYSIIDTAGTTPSAAGLTSATGIVLIQSPNNSSSNGIVGDLIIPNIQGVKYTQCNWRLNCLNAAGSSSIGISGFGNRAANGNITGIKLFPNSGTFSGKITVLGTSN